MRVHCLSIQYCQVRPEILYAKVSDKMAYANSADPDQIAPKAKFRPKKYRIKHSKFYDIYHIYLTYRMLYV